MLAYGLPNSYLMGGATRSQVGARSSPQPRSSYALASLRLPRPAPPAYGLQRPLSFLVLRALSPHRSVGLVVAAAPFHRHYGLCLYRLPPLLFVLKAPPLAVLRSPRRVLRPRLTPVGGWSRGFAPTRALRPVSHSARALSPNGSWARLPPLTRRAVRSGLRPSPIRSPRLPRLRHQRTQQCQHPQPAAAWQRCRKTLVRRTI